MPIIKSAAKKLRQDKKRQKANQKTLAKMKLAIKTTKLKNTPKNIQDAYSMIDTAAKKHVIHKNKAARLKHQVSHKS